MQVLITGIQEPESRVAAFPVAAVIEAGDIEIAAECCIAIVAGICNLDAHGIGAVFEYLIRAEDIAVAAGRYTVDGPTVFETFGPGIVEGHIGSDAGRFALFAGIVTVKHRIAAFPVTGIVQTGNAETLAECRIAFITSIDHLYTEIVSAILAQFVL